MALSFLAPWNDDDLEHGSVDGQFYMREKSPGTFDRVYGGRSGYVHSVPEDGFVSDPRLTRSERINSGPVKPSGREHIPDALAALRASPDLLLANHGDRLPWEDDEKTASTALVRRISRGLSGANMPLSAESIARAATTMRPGSNAGTAPAMKSMSFSLGRPQVHSSGQSGIGTAPLPKPVSLPHLSF